MSGKNISILIMFALLTTDILAQVWNGKIDTEWYWDNASQAEFTIATAEQLAGLAQLVNGGNNFQGKTIKLGANIMLNDKNLENYGVRRQLDDKGTWTTIGTYTNKNNNNPFSGTFDGNNYVVSGVYINSSENYQGLFGYISGAIIKNLGITASYIKGDYFVGGLVGFSNNGTITNCYTTGSINGSKYGIGGLVGLDYGGTITNSYATGNVNGDLLSYVGGLVGSNGDRIKDSTITGATITNSYATGNVSGSRVGGLIGENYNGTITNSYAKGNIDASSYGGGLVGNTSGGYYY